MSIVRESFKNVMLEMLRGGDSDCLPLYCAKVQIDAIAEHPNTQLHNTPNTQSPLIGL